MTKTDWWKYLNRGRQHPMVEQIAARDSEIKALRYAIQCAINNLDWTPPRIAIAYDILHAALGGKEPK